MKPYDKDYAWKEYSLQKMVHAHPHIVSVFDLQFQLSSCLIFMQYAGSRTLFDLIDEEMLDDRQRIDILDAISNALAYMHFLQVAHLDLKPENVIVDDKDITLVRLTDFGCAWHVSHPKKACGTFGYCAPEVTRTFETSPMLADVWSFGVLTIALFDGVLPFECCDESACTPFGKFCVQQKENLGSPPSECIDKSYSSPPFVWREPEIQIVDSCLWLQPEKRRSWRHVRHILHASKMLTQT